MRCEAIKKDLAAYRDGELSQRARARVAVHIKECASCAREEAFLGQVDQLLCQMTRLTPSPGFAEAFWRRLEEEGQVEERGYLAHWWRDFVERWRLVPALAAAAALLVVASYVILSSRVETLPVATPSPVAGLPRRLVEQPELFLQYRLVAEVDKLANFEAILAQRDEAELSGLTAEVPPSKLLDKPGLFVDYYLLRKMEQLQNFEAVQSVHIGGEETGRG
jgi:hypothetical protein